MDTTTIWYYHSYIFEYSNVSNFFYDIKDVSDHSNQSLITIFLYMTAELSALSQIITALTGLNGLPALIVEAIFTAVYTSLGGFRVSFITDNIQGAMVVGLLILAVITVGVETRIDPELVQSSGLLQPSLLGWQLLYILPVAILTNDFFISGFWMRTFASKTDRDLRIGTSIATVAISVILVLVGVTGLLAAWTGVYPGDPPSDGSIAFFLLLGSLPNWVVGIVVCMTIVLSTAAFDSFVSSMVSTGSNDFFRNKLNIWIIRIVVLLISIPVIVVALKAPSVLTIYLISDLLSASSIPVLVIGLSDRCYMWRGFEVVMGGLGGLLTVFIFGTIYYGDASQGAGLLIIKQGLYANDWSVFGAFVAAPVGGLLFAAAAFCARITTLWTYARITNTPFTALDKPIWLESAAAANNGVDVYTGAHYDESRDDDDVDAVGAVKSGIVENSGLKGKFF